MARIIERNGKYKVIIETGRDERTGKRVRHTKEGFKTKKEAKAYASIKENELLSGLIPTNNKILLKDFISDWYTNHICNSNFALNTLTNYKARIETHIIPHMGNMQLTKIKVLDVQNFYYDLIKNGLKPNSAKRVILVLRKCLSYAKKMNLINQVPCDIEFFKEVKEKKIQYWTEQQLLFFLNEIKDTYLYFPVLLAVFTGMRIGELCGLRYKNINLKDLRINICEQTLNDKINKTLVHTNILKTSKSNREITIPNFLTQEIVRNKSSGSNSNDFVILNRNNEMCNPRNLSMEFTKKVFKYSEPVNDNSPAGYIQLPQISFHDLRHTHATILLLHGENIKVISERLGHESVKITLDTYSHVLPSMEEHTSLLLENIFKDKI
ncbi:site-specific integrase [Clostridium sp.]|uniref:site-specific integrase n=1 Tax=Clostridium sp. TaxID=1506 RepID=UPI002910BBAC|nr:site-specific integrase [Clostridium sp.]MDU3526582.1 site-specific integrase [Clostridium sp.]